MKNTKNKILKTAQRLYNQKGLESVSIRGIAAEMGISHGNLMYHYENKEVLTKALLKNNHADFTEVIAKNNDPSFSDFLEFCIKHRWIWCGKRELKHMEMHEELIHFENSERQFWEDARPQINSTILLWLTEAWLMQIPLNQKSGFENYMDSFRNILSELESGKAKPSKTKKPSPVKKPKKSEPDSAAQGSLF